MVEEANSQENSETVTEKVFTPETFSRHLEDNPAELLDIPLDFPYSAEEWDGIFETFIDLLEDEDP